MKLAWLNAGTQRQGSNYVLADHIELQVNCFPREHCLEVGVFVRVRDDGNGELISCYVEDSEADAVQTDGSLVDHELCIFGRKSETVFPASVPVVDSNRGSGCIYMSLYQMTIEPGIYR